jgi:hypothetical protein
MEPQTTRPVEGVLMPTASADTLPSMRPNGAMSPENAPYPAEFAPGPLQPSPLQATPPIPQHLQTNPGPQVGATPVIPGALGANGLPAMADDTDLIEKEWVIKAKQIVEHTKTDPYEQSKQLNKIKAEYIKKRYNKEIKLPES